MQISVLKILIKPEVRCQQGQACNRGERRGLQTRHVQGLLKGTHCPGLGLIPYGSTDAADTRALTRTQGRWLLCPLGLRDAKPGGFLGDIGL